MSDDVVSHILFVLAVDLVGMDVHAKFGDSMLNSARIIRLWPAGPVLCTFVHYLIAFCSRPETATDVTLSFVGPIVPDGRVKFCDPRLNHS